MGLSAYLPDWLEDGIDSALRNSPDEAPTPEYPQITSQSSAPRTAGSARGTPVVLTPTGPLSPVPQSDSKGAFTDLERFYEDTHAEDPETESEESEDESSEAEEEDEEEEDEGEDEEDGEGEQDEAEGDRTTAASEEFGQSNDNELVQENARYHYSNDETLV